MKIAIDTTTCIKCGKCVRVCPSGIFQRSTRSEIPQVCNPETCIGCGHCTAVCPTFAVQHELFPEKKIHRINRDYLPSPQQIMELIRSRRSNRAFSSEPIPDDYFDMILEAAHRAPTASNLQQVSFTLVNEPEKIKFAADFTMEVFNSLSRKLDTFLMRPIVKRFAPDAYRMLPMFRRLQENHKAGGDPVLRKATALLLIHTPENSRFGCQDSNLAYQNASLMAESLGVAHFYTGFLCTAASRDKQNRLAEGLGFTGRVHAGMAMAMPSFRYPNYIDKKDIEVNYIL